MTRALSRLAWACGLASLFALSGACCVPVKPPPPPPAPSATLAIVVIDRGSETTGERPAGDYHGLPGAAVTVDGVAWGITDQDGVISKVVPHGEHRIEVTHEGFEPYAGARTISANTDHWVKLAAIRPPPLRLRANGRGFVYADGRRFVWRGATAFRLLDLVADGDTAAAEAFLSWAQATGFNLLRVLTMVRWTDAELRATDGEAALSALLSRAEVHGLYLELVAVASSRDFNLSRDELRGHVRAVGQACASSPACAAVELANENWHPSQIDALREEGFLRELRALIPSGVLVSFGSNCCGQSDEPEAAGADPHTAYPPELRGGDYLTVHVDRSRDRWDRTRHVRELETLSALTGKPVVSDEPIGAAEADEPGRRSSFAPEFFGQGVLSRVFEIGATFHSSDGLYARVPGATQQACAAAFVAGTVLWPDETRVAFYNAGWPGSPIRSAAFDSAVLRAYSGIAGDHGWTVLVGLRGDPRLELNDGWALGPRVAARPEIEVWEVHR